VKQNVVNYIQDNLSEKITIELLANSAHLSPSHFSRAFKETFGQSPYEFIMASRLHYARNQIIQTDLPFKQIAKNSGFSNNSHMTSVMQKMWSLGPRQIRHERS
jgi:AraC family transcriptional regulator